MLSGGTKRCAIEEIEIKLTTSRGINRVEASVPLLRGAVWFKLVLLGASVPIYLFSDYRHYYVSQHLLSLLRICFLLSVCGVKYNNR